MKKLLLVLCTVLTAVFCFSGCGTVNDTPDTPEVQVDTAEKVEVPKVEEPSVSEYHDDKNPVVTIEMENGGVMKAELFPQVAPNTVNNFISLINKGHYDGLIFHRVIPGFMIQGGAPEGTGMGGPGYSIRGEFSINGFENNLKHTMGVLSMARSQLPDSAGSQFFIMVADNQGLDGQYAAFGQITEGMNVAMEIAYSKTDANDKPVTDVVIKKITVDTKGVTYPEPETMAE